MDLLSLPLAAIAEAAGTPALVLSEQLLRAQTEAFRAAAAVLPGVRLHYSVKSNDHPRIVDHLARSLDGLELISGKEQRLAESLGVPGARLILNGPNKSDAELERALRTEVSLINLDGLAEARRLETIAQRLDRATAVGVRLAFDPVGTWSKFGLSSTSEELRALSELVRSSRHLRLTAVHYHGDHELERGAGLAPLLARLRAETERLRGEGHAISILDLGGGWDPVVEIGGEGRWRRDSRTPRAFADVAAFLSAWGSSAPLVVLEPGRALVEASIVALTRVGNVKRDRQQRFTYVDLSTGYVGGKHPCDRRIQMQVAPARTGASVKQVVCGPLCTGSDVLGELDAPELERGDLLAIANAGAYTLTLRYHSTQREPGLVWLPESGPFEILRRPEADA